MDSFKDYKAARAVAQQKANAFGYDFGLEFNKLFKEYNVFMLPNAKNRCGHELRCEVVSCESMENTKPGHGSKA